MAPIALAFAVLDIGSASDLGLVLAAGWVPQVVFILAGGVWSDRLPRNVVMVWANVLSGAAQAGVATLLLLDRAHLWHLVVLQIVRGTATSFFFPASQGVVPQVVGPEHLQPANAVLRLSINSTNILGTALGGGLVAAIGSGWAIAFDSVTYFASAIVLSQMRIRLKPREAGGSFVRELAEGWHEFWSRTWLWLIVVAAAIGNMVWSGSQGVLGPVVAKESLHGAAGWGAILAVSSAGLVTAGVISLRWRPRRLLLAGCLALFVIPLFLAALAGPVPFPLMLATSFTMGLGIEIFGVCWTTALQQNVPDEVLARVNSYDALGSFVFIPLGLTIIGPVSDVVGVSTTLWSAAAISLATVFLCLASRDVWRLERTA